MRSCSALSLARRLRADHPPFSKPRSSRARRGLGRVALFRCVAWFPLCPASPTDLTMTVAAAPERARATLPDAKPWRQREAASRRQLPTLLLSAGKTTSAGVMPACRSAGRAVRHACWLHLHQVTIGWCVCAARAAVPRRACLRAPSCFPEDDGYSFCSFSLQQCNMFIIYHLKQAVRGSQSRV